MGELRSNVLRLTGERYNLDYLFDTSCGAVVQRVASEAGERGAGLGRRCGRRFVALYLGEAGEVVLQVDRRRFPLDGATRVSARPRLAGLVSELRVERDGERPVVVRQWLPGAVTQELLDVTYDELDRAADDFLGNVADIAQSGERLAWFRQVRSRGSKH